MTTSAPTATEIAAAYAACPQGNATVTSSVIAGQPWATCRVTAIKTDGDTLYFTRDGIWYTADTRSDINDWYLDTDLDARAAEILAAYAAKLSAAIYDDTDAYVIITDAETRYLTDYERSLLGWGRWDGPAAIAAKSWEDAHLDAPSNYLTDEAREELGQEIDGTASGLFAKANPMEVRALMILAGRAAFYARDMATKYPTDAWATDSIKENHDNMTLLGFSATDIADIERLAR